MKFSVQGMGCAACVNRVENAVKSVNGVSYFIKKENGGLDEEVSVN